MIRTDVHLHSVCWASKILFEASVTGALFMLLKKAFVVGGRQCLQTFTKCLFKLEVTLFIVTQILLITGLDYCL